MIEAIVQSAILLALIGTYEVRIRGLDARLRNAVGRREVEDLIDLKLEVLHSQNADLKDDIRRLEHKIDILIAKKD